MDDILRQNNELGAKLMTLGLFLQQLPLQIIMAIESPKNEETHSDIGLIHGWVASDKKIEKVEWWLNGEYKGNMLCCYPRADVEKAHPDKKHVGGWGRTFSFGGASGVREVVVRVTDTAGGVQEKTVRFNTIDIKSLKNLHFGEAQVEVFDDALILRDVRNEKGQYFDLEMKWDWRLRQFTVVDVVSTSDDNNEESGGQDQDGSSGDNRDSNDSGSSGGNDSGSPGGSDDSGSSGGSDDSGSDGGGTSTNIIEEATYQGQLIELVNQYRAEGHTCGSEYYPPADPLTWNSKLETAARRHSRDMADNDFFSHTGSDGTNVADRAREAGYDYSYIAENIAAGYKTPVEVMEAWMASPPHCTSIMSKNYREFGNAMVRSENTQYPTYWTMVFGDQ